MTEKQAWLKPVGPAELLTPEEVRELSKTLVGSDVRVRRLCRDYLTLWERNKELEALTTDLEAQVMDYATRVKELEDEQRLCCHCGSERGN